MANRNRRIILQKQHRHRLADDVAAPDNNGVLTGNFDIKIFQNFNYARRSAGRKSLLTACQPSDIDRMKTVNVLFGNDSF